MGICQILSRIYEKVYKNGSHGNSFIALTMDLFWNTYKQMRHWVSMYAYV